MTHPLPPFPGRALVGKTWTDESHCNAAVLNEQTLTFGDLAIGHCLFISLPAFRTQACTEGMCSNRTHGPCEVPSLPSPTTLKGWPHQGDLRTLLFSNSAVGSFTSQKNKAVKVLWDETHGFSSLSEKTRKSNHLQMSLQRQHFLLSYLKTLSVGPAGVWNRDLS